MHFDKVEKIYQDMVNAVETMEILKHPNRQMVQKWVNELKVGLFTEAVTEMISRPTLGSRWRHTNGNYYTVTGYSNDTAPSDKYPLTIHYQGDNGNQWSRQLSRWHDSMTFVPTKRRDLSVGVCQARQSSDEMFCHHCSLRCDVNESDPPECGRLKGHPMRTGGAP
jgi:hypothetical protein